MNRIALKSILDQLGASQVELAKLVQVTPRAVSLWMTGARSIPGPLVAYLELLTSLPVGMRQAELNKIHERTKSMKDGFYSIEFTGQAGQGFGMLVFEGGRVYGADVGSGKYDGNYEFNEKTGNVDVKIRVELAANRPSVIGLIQPFDWILEVTTQIDPEKESGEILVNSNLGRPIKAVYTFLRELPVAA